MAKAIKNNHEKQVSTGVHRRERQLSGRNDRARSEEERWEILIDTLCHQNSSSYCFFERERDRGEVGLCRVICFTLH